MEEPEQNAQRNSQGQFIAGHKISRGNRGNPKGSGPPKSPKLLSLLDETLTRPEQMLLLRKFLAMAEDGDSLLARAFVDKMLAPLKPRAAPIIIEDLDTSSTISIASGVLAAIADGRIDPEAGQQLIKSVESLSNIITNESLAPQLEEMREQMASMSRR